jgi:hypothetical protein
MTPLSLPTSFPPTTTNSLLAAGYIEKKNLTNNKANLLLFTCQLAEKATSK